MSPVNSVDDIANALGNTNQTIPLATTTALSTAVGADTFLSMWTAVGIPGNGITLLPNYLSGGPYTCSSGTLGAIPINPGGQQNYLAAMSLVDTVGAAYVLADRLWHCSLFPPVGAGGGTLNITTPGSLPARITDNGVGCQMFIETVSGTNTLAAASFTITYKDSNNISRTTTAVANAANPAIGYFRHIPHAAGAYGVSQITSVVRTGSWTVGTLAVVIAKPLLDIPSVTTAGTTLDWAQTRLPKIHNDACPMMYRYSTVTTAAGMWGSLSVIDK